MRWLGHGLRCAQTLPASEATAATGRSGSFSRCEVAAEATRLQLCSPRSVQETPRIASRRRALLPAHRFAPYQTVAKERAVRWRVTKTTHPDSMHAMRLPLNPWRDSQNHRADSTREPCSATDARMTEDADALDEPR